MPTIGIKNKNKNHQGFPKISSKTNVEYIGIIDAHPGLPAFV